MSNADMECIDHAPARADPLKVSNKLYAAADSYSAYGFLPSPPSKFNRRQEGRIICNSAPLHQSNSEQDFIQAIRRKTCEQIYASDLCLMGAADAGDDLWAAIDHIFLQ